MSALTWQEQLGTLAHPFTFQFLDQIDARIRYLRSYVSTPRTNSIYVNNSTGNDSNAGTQASPFKTISKVNSILAPNTVVYFASGVEDNSQTGLVINVPHVTIDIYGGTKPAFFNAFSTKVTSGWVNVAGTTWTYATALPVAYVRMTGPQSLGATSGQALPLNIPLAANLYPLVPMSSLADCEANVGTFYTDGASVVAINLGSTAAPPPMEFATTATATLNPVMVNNVDDVLIRGIRSDGFTAGGVNGVGQQSTGSMNNTTVLQQVTVWDSCENYFASYHNFEHTNIGGNGQAGGITLWRNCKAGFMPGGSSGGDNFVDFNAYGGQEGYFDGCVLVAGCLPNPAGSVLAPGAYSASGGPFYAHTAGGTVYPSLEVVRNARLKYYTPYSWVCTPIGGQPDGGNPTLTRVFYIGCSTDSASSLGNMVTSAPIMNVDPGSSQYNGCINCSFDWVVSSSAYYSSPIAGSFAGWAVNCEFNLNVQGKGTQYLTGSSPNSAQFYFCRLRVEGYAMGTIGYSGMTGTTFENCDLVDATESATTGWSIDSSLPVLLNNCYSSHLLTISTTDATPVAANHLHIPRELPVPGSELYQTGKPVSGMPALQYDMDGNPRNLATPNIGPRETAWTPTFNLSCAYTTGGVVVANVYSHATGALAATVTLTETPAASGNYLGTFTATAGTLYDIIYSVGLTEIARGTA
ncbi:MAG: hypothetical protein ACP5I8_15290 [Phycisphaerae bacterium]